MIAKINAFTLMGLNGIPIEVEVDVNNGLPAFDVVGLADTAVKEAKERVRSAIKNSGRQMPVKHLTVNLAPADVKKEGSSLDLAIAIGVLVSSGQIEADVGDTVFIGELSLDGSLRRVNGVLPILISALDTGYKKFIIPEGNAKEASFVDGIEVVAASSLKAVIDHLSGLTVIAPIKKCDYIAERCKNVYSSDLSLVKGQATAKRALEVAVSGGHTLLFVGALDIYYMFSVYAHTNNLLIWIYRNYRL